MVVATIPVVETEHVEEVKEEGVEVGDEEARIFTWADIAEPLTWSTLRLELFCPDDLLVPMVEPGRYNGGEIHILPSISTTI